MKKIVAFIGIVLAAGSLRMCAAQNQYNTEKLNVYYNTGQVVSNGQCNKTDCSFTVKTSDGVLVNATASDPVSTGQLVYQMCWTERVKGLQCYVNYSPTKRG